MERKCMLVTPAPEYGSMEEIKEFERGNYGIIDGAVWRMCMAVASTLADLQKQLPIEVFRRCTHLAWLNVDLGEIVEFCGSPRPYRIVDDRIEFLATETARQIAGSSIEG